MGIKILMSVLYLDSTSLTVTTRPWPTDCRCPLICCVNATEIVLLLRVFFHKHLLLCFWRRGKGAGRGGGGLRGWRSFKVSTTPLTVVSHSESVDFEGMRGY